MSIIYGNVVGGGSGFGKTFLLEDESGKQLTGIVVDDVVVFTATPDDIKLGKTAGTNSGVVTGTHVCE